MSEPKITVMQTASVGISPDYPGCIVLFIDDGLPSERCMVMESASAVFNLGLIMQKCAHLLLTSDAASGVENFEPMAMRIERERPSRLDS